MRRNGLVKVPQKWVEKIVKVYETALQGGAPGADLYLKVSDLPYDAIAETLKEKVYPTGRFRLKVRVSGGMGSTLGSVGYPKHGRSLTMTLAPMKRYRSTITHETRHVVQHLGDMALRAEVGKKIRGRFGRPSPETVKLLRDWKGDVKSGKIKATEAEWYYRSPSEYMPHVGDAAQWVVRKSGKGASDKTIRSFIRIAIATKPIFQYLNRAQRRHGVSALYQEVQRLREA